MKILELIRNFFKLGHFASELSKTIDSIQKSLNLHSKNLIELRKQNTNLLANQKNDLYRENSLNHKITDLENHIDSKFQLINKKMTDLENRFDELYIEIRGSISHTDDKRLTIRNKVHLESIYNDNILQIIDMSETGVGFFSDHKFEEDQNISIQFDHNEAREKLLLKIIRSADADKSIANFDFFHGAAITQREIIN